MVRHILMLPVLVVVALAEPPVPQGQYGVSGGFGSGGYPGGAGGGSPSSQYGAPGGFGSGGYPGGAGGGTPSSQYGAPGGFGSGGYPGGAGGGSPSSQYGPPGFGAGGGYSGGGGGYKDPRDTPMFSHEQDFQRPGGEIWGKWSVVLPDGRTQKVEYDADETGFHPIITYEEPGGGNGGYGSGGNGRGGNGGYSSGGKGGFNSGKGGYSYR